MVQTKGKINTSLLDTIVCEKESSIQRIFGRITKVIYQTLIDANTVEQRILNISTFMVLNFLLCKSTSALFSLPCISIYSQ